MHARAAVIALWLSAMAPAVHALDVRALKPQGYVSDFAGKIDPASRTQLERYAAQLESRTGVELALVTLSTLDGEPVEDVANRLFETWGIGKKGKNEGVLLLLAIAERRSRLEVGYGLEPVLPDGAAGDILRSMRPALRENHYGDAFILAARRIGERVALAKGIDPATLDAPKPVRARRGRGAESEDLWPLLVLAGVVLLLGRISSRRGRGGYPGVWTIPGGGWHGSGGGFGAGGFGGFGGGSSGGGGASSSW
jgi:uncharacterized protein